MNYSEYIAISEYERGYKDGYEEGRKKRVFEEKIKAAKNFFAYGYSIEDVRKIYPDLSIDLLTYLKSESDSQEK